VARFADSLLVEMVRARLSRSDTHHESIVEMLEPAYTTMCEQERWRAALVTASVMYGHGQLRRYWDDAVQWALKVDPEAGGREVLLDLLVRLRSKAGQPKDFDLMCAVQELVDGRVDKSQRPGTRELALLWNSRGVLLERHRHWREGSQAFAYAHQQADKDHSLAL